MDTQNTDKAVTASPSVKRYVVYADYFESGNRYEISRWGTIQEAHMIAQAAERNLTESERAVFGYTIGRK